MSLDHLFRSQHPDSPGDCGGLNAGFGRWLTGGDYVRGVLFYLLNAVYLTEWTVDKFLTDRLD